MTDLRILLDGVDRWNAWRKKDPDREPLLRGVDLRGRMLRGVNLRSADLSNADLRDVSFRRANLRGANLNGAKLNRVFFSGTNLQAATLRGARLYETVFANADLSDAKGLAECDHRGPSVIDQRTLARSGTLPHEFLRGCGFPEDYIRFQSSVPSQTYFSCFISYSSADEAFARKLYADLQNSGVRCWFAPEDMKIGRKLRDSIDNGIRAREKLLLILSRNSLSSRWVGKEVETAFEEEGRRRESVVFPIRLDDEAMSVAEGWPADIRRALHIGDFKDWRDEGAYQGAFERLLRDLTVGTDA